MREFRFYSERKNLRVGSSVKLPAFEAAHIVKSLRLKKGDEVFIFNGEKEYSAILRLVSREAVMVKIVKEIRAAYEKPFEIDLIQGLSKPKSFEMILEKATEIGINSIVPLNTEYSVINISEKFTSKLERWKKIIISSCKQAKRIHIPEITEPIESNDIKEVSRKYDLILFLTTKEEGRASIINVLEEVRESGSAKIGILIGTEGGFSPGEIKGFLELENVKKIKLTENVLRSETAAILTIGACELFLNNS